MASDSGLGGLRVIEKSDTEMLRRFKVTDREIKQDLGKDEFLMLLMAQLQNQDPMAPQDNSQFIAQMAQFSSLQQMQNLNTASSISQAYNLINKGVYAKYMEQNAEYHVQGCVKSVLVENGTAKLVVADLKDPNVMYKVPAEKVIQVWDVEDFPDGVLNTGGNTNSNADGDATDGVEDSTEQSTEGQ